MATTNGCGARALVALSRGGHELAAALRVDGWDVEIAHSGSDVAFKLWPFLQPGCAEGPPQFIVVSAYLSGMSGLSLLAEIRALGWMCPVFVAVDADANDARRDALALGADAIFDDPIYVPYVVDAIREYRGQPPSELPLLVPAPLAAPLLVPLPVPRKFNA